MGRKTAEKTAMSSIKSVAFSVVVKLKPNRLKTAWRNSKSAVKKINKLVIKSDRSAKKTPG